VEAQLQKMTLREKVGQLFYVRPECLDTTIHFNQPSGIDASSDDIKAIKLQAVNVTMKGVNEKYPVGGIILYAHNIEDEAQLTAFISQIRALKGSPLLCIDEEGGRVARIGNNANFDVETFKSMEAIADIVLGPQNFVGAFDAVVKAVEDGRLSEQRIDQSVRRILRLKKQIGVCKK
jgi:beta-N-acetylhexosaminidase